MKTIKIFIAALILCIYSSLSFAVPILDQSQTTDIFGGISPGGSVYYQWQQSITAGITGNPLADAIQPYRDAPEVCCAGRFYARKTAGRRANKRGALPSGNSDFDTSAPAWKELSIQGNGCASSHAPAAIRLNEDCD